MRKICLWLGAMGFVAFGSYIYGAISYPQSLWPIATFMEIKRSDRLASHFGHGIVDRFGRLTTFPNKLEVECPRQNAKTGVLLAMGQSNSANSGEEMFVTKYPRNVINYFDGKCFVASSPLLGATGEEGEFLTLLADELVSRGVYENVIIISSGINGTPIARWQEDGDLNDMLLASLKKITPQYDITDIVWHQGEADFINGTSEKVYKKSFVSLRSSLQAIGVNAPYFIAVASKCGKTSVWHQDNPTAEGQKKLVHEGIAQLGANTDDLLGFLDRRADGCHLSETGQRKTASAYAGAIESFHRKN